MIIKKTIIRDIKMSRKEKPILPSKARYLNKIVKIASSEPLSNLVVNGELNFKAWEKGVRIKLIREGGEEIWLDNEQAKALALWINKDLDIQAMFEELKTESKEFDDEKETEDD